MKTGRILLSLVLHLLMAIVVALAWCAERAVDGLTALGDGLAVAIVMLDPAPGYDPGPDL